MVVRELITVLGFKVDINKLKAVDKRLGRISKIAKNANSNLKSMAANVRNIGLGLTIGLTLPIALLGRGMIKAAADAEESDQKFNVIFRSIAAESKKTADSLSKDFGLAGSTSRELLGDTGDLLTGFGFTQVAALKMSDSVQRLAGDLASFQNIEGGVAEAGFKLTKGILGETENLKALGIVVNQGTKEFKKRTKEIMIATNVTEQQAKVQNILEQAFRQSKNAIGDYARTSDSLTNKTRELEEKAKNLREEFGKLLVPIALKVVKILLKLVEVLTNLPKSVKVFILIIGSLLAVLGPLLLIVGLISQGILGIIGLFAALGGGVAIKALLITLGILGAKFILIAALIAAVGVGIFFLIKNFDDVKLFFIDTLDVMIKAWNDFWNLIFNIAAAPLNFLASLADSLLNNKATAFLAPVDSVSGAGRKMQAPSLFGNVVSNGGGGSNVSTSIVNVKVAVEPGTSEQQKKSIQKTAKQVYTEMNNSQLFGTINANPKKELG